MISSFGVCRSTRVLNPGDLFAEISGHITGALTRHRSITKRKTGPTKNILACLIVNYFVQHLVPTKLSRLKEFRDETEHV